MCRSDQSLPLSADEAYVIDLEGRLAECRREIARQAEALDRARQAQQDALLAKEGLAVRHERMMRRLANLADIGRHIVAEADTGAVGHTFIPARLLVELRDALGDSDA